MKKSEIKVDLLLEQTTVNANDAKVLHGMVRLAGSRDVATAGRAPLDIVACTDVSGSMEGPKIARVCSALVALLSQLREQDRFGMVVFNERAKTVFLPRSMTSSGKEDARAIVRALAVGGGTNLAAGLRNSLDMLRDMAGDLEPDAPRPMQRVLLFTDGHANVGLDASDMEEWGNLLGGHLGTASASFLGFGEDHDSALLGRLAVDCRGNYYCAANEDSIADAFGKEVGGLIAVACQDVDVEFQPGEGLPCPVPVNHFRLDPVTGRVKAHLDDVYADETRYVVFTLPAPKDLGLSEAAPERTLGAKVTWCCTVTGEAGEAEARVTVRLAAPAEVPFVNTDVLERVVLVKAAKAQRKAAEFCSQDQFSAGVALIMQVAEEARAIGTDRAKEVARLLEGLADEYRDQRHFAATHSTRESTVTGISAMRTSGSVFDHLFATESQVKAARYFAMHGLTDTSLVRFRGPKN
jgi:Mg-chelatase subunit ChlD